jgi:hypothetical protein
LDVAQRDSAFGEFAADDREPEERDAEGAERDVAE